MIGDYGEVYLLDWGIALNLDKTSHIPIGLVGTPAYMAPEILGAKPRYGFPADIFSYGIVLNEIFSGKCWIIPCPWISLVLVFSSTPVREADRSSNTGCCHARPKTETCKRRQSDRKHSRPDSDVLGHEKRRSMFA